MGNLISKGKMIYRTLGASNHTDKEREENDYYATDPRAGELLMELETFSHNIWECACGEGHLSKVFEKAGHSVRSTDLVDRGYGTGGIDFIGIDNIDTWDGDIITNPPYKFAQEFIEKALEIIPVGNKVAMFLKLQFLEGQKRKELFKRYPPQTVYVSSSRILCAKNGKFAPVANGRRIPTKGFISNSAIAYIWIVWQKGFNGKPVIEWFN